MPRKTRMFISGYLATWFSVVTTVHLIRKCSQRNFLLGNDRFKNEIEETLNRRVGQLERGRPTIG